MVAYEFYWCDVIRGRDKLIGILPERRKNSERITEESIMNWVKKLIGKEEDVRQVFFIRVTVD
jgi:hypothetical protein